tara:strand:+ start:34 stop:705 length:672 start_codon:yes stop_codon:yes gene_type:complete
MGILNNDTVIVDAILTKAGRRLLAMGQGLNIRQFALFDDWTNYGDYNPDHPSGSDSYGEAITSLPLPEATTDARNAARFPLGSRDRNTIYNPYIIIPDQHDGDIVRIQGQGKQYSVAITPKIENGTVGKGFVFSFDDISGLQVTGAGGGALNMGGSVHKYPKEVGVANPFEYMGTTINIMAEPTKVAFERLLTVKHHASGAAPKDYRILVDANIYLKPTEKIS